MQQTRRVTEGAVLSGVFIVMLLLAVFVPFLSMILLWFLPLPFILFTARYGWKPGIVMAVVSMLLSVFLTALTGLPFAVLSAVGGIAMGEMMSRRKEALLTAAAASVAYIGGLTALYAGSVLLLQVDPISVLQDIMRQSAEQAQSMLSSLGQESSVELEQYGDMIDRFGRMGPLLIVFTGVLYAFLTQFIAHAVMRRMNMEVEAFPPFRNWNIPRSLLWYYLLTFIVYWVGVEEGTAVQTVVWNLFPLLETAMALQGFTVIFYYCYSKSIPKALPILLLVFGLILPFILLLARMLGIIDLGFQLKKRLESDTK
ncbi:YybS family protein [Salibacterium halotolerans]|uniref:YybS family protein n=1 Tax=Salibacterium halotolerans TaxID=1884432 RepID=UPI00147CC68A|nr:YybS family protein [Salibacterium halotolerans]